MGSITIRNIDDEIKRGARLAAAANDRSLEAELRALLKRTYAPVIDDRTARLRAMSGKEAVAHLIKVANGAGEGVFDNGEGNFRDFDL
ncbi:MAG: FitA-like ribbon-helix-helix domain-containing protein [Janthinobacterium lividum]